MWPNGEHSFSCRPKTIQEQLKGRPKAAHELELGQTSPSVLDQHGVEALLVDDNDVGTWRPWIEHPAGLLVKPRIIVWMTEDNHLLHEGKGPVCKDERKSMNRPGCTTLFWYLQADNLGPALVQDQLAVVYLRPKRIPLGLSMSYVLFTEVFRVLTLVYGSLS